MDRTEAICKLESDLISRQAAIEALTGWQTDPTDEEIVRTLKELPPVEPTHDKRTETHGVCSDCISRKQAIKPFCITPDGTRIPEVDCDNFPVEFSVKDIKRHLLSLPPVDPVAESATTTDCISRQQAIEVISNCKGICDCYDDVKTLINNIPPVEPEPYKAESEEV